MIHLSPIQLILVGFILSLLGVALPFLMVIRIIPSTFFLNFFSYISSFIGLLLGTIGAASYIKERRK
ncbi:MAG: hypothetical protein HYR70_02720 [Chloroflexi bacterium]|nr:hypothetical protein [Chloroflexota bacterium]MBI3339921.1 hypothetical protein [Chloroflexota bacterium]